jgi:hypothetical protein
LRNPLTDKTTLVEVKHSAIPDKAHARHLLSADTAKYFPDADKIVCFNGNSTEIDGVKYLNVREFLTDY